MFITQGFKPQNRFWKYLIGSLIVFIASQIGSIPLLAVIFFESQAKNKDFTALTQNQDQFMSFLEPNLNLFLMLLIFVFAFLTFFIVVKYLHNQTITEVTTSRIAIDWRRIFFSFILWVTCSSIIILIDYAVNPQDYIFNFKPVPFAILFVITVVLIPIQTSTEEYLFRGYLMQGFGLLSKNKWFPLLMTSLIFGILHIVNPEVSKMGNIAVVYYIGTGLFLGIITLMDEGIELALGYHAANNLAAALLVTSDWTVLQTHSVLKQVAEPETGFESVLPVFVVFPILIFVLSKKYNWTHWKEKLTGTIENPLG
jgi:uncharacterized protein